MRYDSPCRSIHLVRTAHAPHKPMNHENDDAMPHLTLEYSANLDTFDAEAILLALNEALAACGHFEEIDIKSRCVRRDAFRVGTSSEPRAFVHATLAILSGRALDTRRALSEQVLAVLKTHCGTPSGVHLQLSAQVVEIERESYAKAAIAPSSV